MSDTTKDQQINFLTTAITDAQELIRFTDTKTAIVITILGAYVVGMFNILDKVIEHCFSYDFWFWVTLILFLFTFLMSLLITSRIIRPTNSPVKNIRASSSELPELQFYLAPNKYKSRLYRFRNCKEDKLDIEYLTYRNAVKAATLSTIIDSLSFELMKVSYIRNIKNDRF